MSLDTSNAYVAKIGVKSAYRHVPIHPTNYNATGLARQFSGDIHLTYMYDSKLPFGASKSPDTFHRIRQAITRMMTRQGFYTVLVYLDDFLIIADRECECRRVYNELIRLLSELCFMIKRDKAEPPTQRLTFLGVDIDTATRQFLLPETKLCGLRELLSETISKRSINTKRE